MQSIKFVVRRLGTPNTELDIHSPEETSQYVAYQYGSQGYELKETHYLGEVKNAQGGVQGWSVMMVLVKNEEEAVKAKAGKDGKDGKNA